MLRPSSVYSTSSVSSFPAAAAEEPPAAAAEEEDTAGSDLGFLAAAASASSACSAGSPARSRPNSSAESEIPFLPGLSCCVALSV